VNDRSQSSVGSGAWPLVGAAVAVVACVGPLSAQQVVDRVLAVVGSSVITASDVRATIELDLLPPAGPAESGRTVLDRLVERELMRLEVVRFTSIEPADEAIAERLATVEGAFPSREQYLDTLSRLGMTESRVVAFVRNDLMIEDYVRQRFAAAAQPIDEDVRSYYRTHLDEFRTAEELLPYEQAEPEARRRLTAARRAALLRQWLDELGRRTEVRRVQEPPS